MIKEAKEVAKFTVIFYKTKDTKPVEEFLESLQTGLRAKMDGLLILLGEQGNMIRGPLSKHLRDGIFELRGQAGSDICRTLFFFYYGGLIVVTNGFVKKTQKTPNKEIELAIKRRADFMERMSSNEK